MVYFINYFIFASDLYFKRKTSNTMSMETTNTKTPKSRRFNRWMRRKLIAYVTVCAFLTFVNVMTSPHYWWVVWVIAGWGLSLLLNTLYYYTDCDDERNYDN